MLLMVAGTCTLRPLMSVMARVDGYGHIISERDVTSFCDSALSRFCRSHAGQGEDDKGPLDDAYFIGFH